RDLLLRYVCWHRAPLPTSKNPRAPRAIAHGSDVLFRNRRAITSSAVTHGLIGSSYGRARIDLDQVWHARRKADRAHSAPDPSDSYFTSTISTRSPPRPRKEIARAYWNGGQELESVSANRIFARVKVALTTSRLRVVSVHMLTPGEKQPGEAGRGGVASGYSSICSAQYSGA